MHEFTDWDAYVAATKAYEAAFGDSLPTFEMPRDPEQAMIAMREAVANHRPWTYNGPANADI